jgi:hypothetical protein
MSLRPLAVPAFGLMVSIGPALLAHIVPKAADLKLLGICVLGALISLSACLRR